MPDFITLTCPSCGHKLQITRDIDRFACSACGNEHIVNRSGGVVTLKPFIDGIERVQVGVDKTASELAITRHNKEIVDLENIINRIMNKGNYFEQNPGCSVLIEVALLVIGILIITSSITAETINPWWIIGVIMIGFGIYLFIFMKQREKENIKRNKEEAKPFLDKYIAKKNELAAHQKFVSNHK
jgi:hypothetical protein